MDRATGSGPVDRGFESLRARFLMWDAYIFVAMSQILNVEQPV